MFKGAVDAIDAFRLPIGLSSREHIIGVTVSETSMETAIEVVRTKANSWNMRPTKPPMKRIGHENRNQRKAHGEDGKADFLRALQGGFHGRHAQFDKAGDVLHHHDRVIDHEAGGDGERHQREIVDAVSHQVHDAEGADQRDTDSHARNQSPARAAQKGEDHRDDQDDRR